MKARFFALAALVLGLASCQQDFNEPTMVGGEVDFQLSVGAGEVTRGLDADGKEGYDSAHGAIDYLSEADWAEYDLRYSLEVYDKADDYTNATPVKDRQVIIVDSYKAVTFDLRLVPNREYHFVVFADFVPQGADATANIDTQSTLGLRHNIGENLGQITIKEDTINDEIADAYFATKDIKITNSAAQDIVLRRPFGKVRVIATDLAELNLNVDPGKVKVAYEAYHPAAFNAVTGEVSGEYTQESYEYVYGTTVGKASLADHLYTQYYDDKSKFGVKNANGVERHTHMTLFTDYILAEKEGQTPYHFTMTVYDKSGAPIKQTVFNTDIPVERNMLTTVIGNVLTTATEINVTIDDNFASEYNVNYVGVASARELQEALNNAKAGENNVINFEADIDAVAEKYNPIIITEIPETTIVLNGNGYKFNGCMQIKGMSEYKNAHTVFQDIKFETADVSSFMGAAFIFCDDEPNTSFRYPDSVTIKGCSFTATGAAEKNAVGVKMWSLKNDLVVENCTANGMHSMVQLSSSGDANVTINGATIENSKNGFGLGQVTTANIKNIVINAVGYGIRLDGATSSTTTIENAAINAFIPVNVRKMNNDAYNVVVKFVDNAAGLKRTSTSDYEIAFCANEYEEGVTPENPKGTFTLQNAEEARAFYGTVTSFSAFDAAINSTIDPNVVVENAIYNNGLGVEVERSVNIDFQNNEYNAGSNANSTWYALEIIGKYDVTIKNANFTRAGIYAAENANVVFDNGTINHKPERTSRYIFCAQSGSTITVKNGTFTNDRAKNSFFWADAATIIVEGGNFGGVASNKKVVTSNGGQVIIKGGTFNFDPTAYVASTSVVEKVGSNWVVTPLPVSNNISDAVANVEDGGKVVLAEGTYAIPSEAKGKTLTIIGDENVIIDATKSYGQSIAGANITFEGVTVKGQTNGNYQGFTHAGNLTFNNCTFEGKLTVYSNTVFNNCTFNNKKDYAVWTSWGGDETKFVGCTFNSGGKALLLYGGSAGSKEKTLIVENCVFNSDATNATDKAAIETGNDYDATYNLYITNATVSDNFSVTTPKQDQGGDSLGTNVWGNKDRMPREKLNVYVDGVDVY